MSRGVPVFLLAVLLVMTSGQVSGRSIYTRFIRSIWTRDVHQLRDQQIRPRLMTQMKLDVSPRVVYAIPDGSSGVGLAVTYTNVTDQRRKVALGRVSNITGYLDQPGNFLSTNNHLEMVGDGVGWPNQVGEVLEEYLANVQPPYWWATTSYYGGSDGKIVLLPANGQPDAAPIQITPEEPTKRDYVYWNIEWADMNADGWADVVASRTQGKDENVKSSELIWLENPGRMNIGTERNAWTVHPITNGPDVNFRIMKIPHEEGGTRNVIIGLGYWNHKMYAVWSEDENEDWSRVDLIKERVIDNHDSFWDLQVADINADGRDDIIVSTYTYQVWRSSLFVYEIPCDFKRGDWTRHILISGGDLMSDEPFNSGPQIKIFHPKVRDSSLSSKKKPFILLSGDNDGYLKVLSPRSREANVWSYSSQVVFKAQGPIGPVALEDLNHDGYTEIIVPVVESQRILFFTYKPSTNPRAYGVDENRENIDELLALLHRQEHHPVSAPAGSGGSN